MLFVDNTGHIFGLPSTDNKPVGYQFQENDFKFWIDNPKSSYLSVNAWYAKVINVLVPYPFDDDELINNIDIEVEIDKSNTFSLIDPEQFNRMISNMNSLTDVVEMMDSDEYVKKTLSTDNMLFVHIHEEDEHYVMVPLYVLAKSLQDGAWSTNILIHFTNKVDGIEDWCPITVAGQFVNVNETLEINGTNLGISLPHDIMRAVWSQSFKDNVFDESLYNDKLKEYLINYMGIRGEQGNFDSAIKSLEWFGYGDKITLSRLFKTDNQFETQYVHDWFKSWTDMLDSFSTFRNSTYISLRINSSNETGEENPISFNEDFWGEGKPVLESLLDKHVQVKVGSELEPYTYWKPYFDWSFNEMGLKLTCLAYYYQKYFLPLHLKIHSASISHQVFTNDVKMLMTTHHTIDEAPLYIEDKSDAYNEVQFGPDVLWLEKEIHLVDDTFNEMKSINDNDDWFHIEDTCCNMTIKFKRYDHPYNCVLLLEKEEPHDKNTYKLLIDQYCWKTGSLQMFDKNGEVIDMSNMSFGWTLDDWKTSSPMHPSLDKMWEALEESSKESVKVTMVDDEKGYVKYIDSRTGIVVYKYITHSKQEYIQTKNGIPYHIIIPSWEECYKNVMNPNDTVIDVAVVPEVKLLCMTDNDNVDVIKYAGVEISFHINPIAGSRVIYESHFTVCQHKDIQSSIYSAFVIYPRMLNRPAYTGSKIYDNHMPEFMKSHEELTQGKNLARLYDNWVGQKFRINLLVNDTWHSHEFTIKMPKSKIELGTLKYKYYIDENNISKNILLGLI